MPSDSTTTLAELREIIRRFVDERDWQQFHSPKNLSMSLAIEAAELMEHFQWIDIAESRALADDPANGRRSRRDCRRPQLYARFGANALNLDLATAVREKMIKNAAKYPVEQSRGRDGRPSQSR